VRQTFLHHAGDPASVRWQFRYFRDVLGPALFESFNRTEPDADAIVGAGVQMAAASAAERWGVTYANAVFCPCAVPNDGAPPPLVKSQGLPRFVNRFLWNWGVPLAGLAMRGMMNEGRSKLGLRPLFDPLSHLLAQPAILAADPDLAPAGDDLPPNVTATEAWVLDEREHSLDPRVARFLDLNPPPVYAGFGSMAAPRAMRLADLVVAAIQAVGHPALIAGGWAGLGTGLEDSDDVLVLEEVPHALVLHRVAAAIHHGGAGTTTAAARAGIPQVILPHLLDQYYWATRIERLGLGPRPLPVDLVTADVLAERLDRALNDPAIRGRARTFGPIVAPRNGVHAAVDVIEQLVPPR